MLDWQGLYLLKVSLSSYFNVLKQESEMKNFVSLTQTEGVKKNFLLLKLVISHHQRERRFFEVCHGKSMCLSWAKQ